MPWVELTSGVCVNLDRIEAIVPVPDQPNIWRFYAPRTQRGGRPIGRPVASPASYNEDRGYWEGQPTNVAGLLLYLRQSLPDEATASLTARPPPNTGIA